jgi:hypothetical protein
LLRQRVLRQRQLHTTDDVHLMDERPLRRSLRNALLCAALSLAGTVAHAQSPSDEAEALIRQGTELRHQDQDAKALPYFEGAYHLSRNPRTAAQLGLVKMALGYCVEGERLLDEALAVPDHPWIARNRATLEQTRDNARKNIGEVVVTGSPDGAEVIVNGRPAGALPLTAPLRLDRGPVEILLRARGYQPATRTLAIKGGARETLALALIPAPPGPAIAEPPAAEPIAALPAEPVPPVVAPASERDRGDRSLLRPLAWTTAGLATASLVFAVVETVTASHRSDDFNGHTSPAPTATDPAHRTPDCQTDQLSGACASLRDSWQRARALAVAGYIGAGVFTGASAALFVLAHRQTASAPVVSAAAPRLACAPALPAAGVTCRLAF